MSGTGDPRSPDQPTPGSASLGHAGNVEPTLPDTTAHPLAGRYQFMGLLGKGGMGSVYRVRDLHLNEEVALKVLRPDLLQSADIVERFRREVRLARHVTHHNVARTFDIGEHEGLRYLTMELIEGEPISKRLRREGPLPLSSVVAIATQMCAGLAAAHTAGIVHGDLKPDNLLITTEGRVAITDFGIARALIDLGPSMRSVERVAGTPTYMAPEQVEGAADIDGRADLYSIGCVLYELLTGVPPWQGHSPYLVATARILNPPPDPSKRHPDLPVAATALVLRCMARDPADRFQSADELGAALLALVAPGPGSAPSVQAPWPRRDPLPAPPGAVVSVAILSFRNAGPAEDEYLAEGITENLIDILSTATCLRVRGAASHPEGHSRDPQDLGRDLNVEAVLLGSIRKAADSLHIHARLVSVADGFQFWAKHFECPSHPDMAGDRYPYARMLLEVASSEKASIDSGAILHGWLDLAHSSERTRAFFHQVQTEVACALGQADTAIDSLAQAVGAGLSDQMWIDHCPVLGPIRDHPRFGPLRDSVQERASRAREVLRVNRK